WPHKIPGTLSKCAGRSNGHFEATGRNRLSGDGRDNRRPVLWVRHWWNTPFVTCSKLAGWSMGPKCRIARNVAGGGGAGRGGTGLGVRGAGLVEEMRWGACDLRDDGEFRSACGSTSCTSCTRRLERRG